MSDIGTLLAQAAAAGQGGDLSRAHALYSEALAAFPGHVAATFGVGQVALAQGDLRRAAESFSAIADTTDGTLRPHLAAAFTGLAHALRSRGARDGAVAAFEQAVRLAPGDAAAWVALGNACMEAAQARVDRARAMQADEPPAYDALGAAVIAFGRAAALAPGVPAIEAHRAMAARYACAFAEADAAIDALERAGASDPGAFACEPMSAVALLCDATLQRVGIGGFVRANLPVPLPTPPSLAVIASRGTRLRVGYLSSDLHDHATAHLAAGMFELHDRTRFEVFAYATDRDDGSAMRARLRGAFEHWRDLRAASDAEAASTMARDGLDILVDLKGHTHGARLAILARRPAPVQVHYLGFPGTLGYGAIDALVVDHDVAPAGSDGEFTETLARLPVCYQVNDHRRQLPLAARRAAVGLPEAGVVLACFNQAYKLSAPMVAAWLAVMRELPDTVLWLTAPYELTRRNLQAAAEREGVAPARLIFAPLTGQAAHLARLRCADLALDVLPYGSHTTGSDALFCGVPLLTLRGSTFAGRVGASLCRAAGLPELVTDSLPAYTALLANLAGDRARLRHYRAHLEQGRTRLPLFDTAGFTRAFEAMLVDMVAR